MFGVVSITERWLVTLDATIGVQFAILLGAQERKDVLVSALTADDRARSRNKDS
jgi:hypothetical protein